MPEEDAWISNEIQERFGLVSLSGELPFLDRIIALIGSEPVISEEFDIE